jgi:bacteriorhodopsin
MQQPLVFHNIFHRSHRMVLPVVAVATVSAIAPRVIIPGFFIGRQIHQGGSMESIVYSSVFTLFFITAVMTAFGPTPLLALIPAIACVAYGLIGLYPDQADLWRYSNWVLTMPLMLVAILYANGAPLDVILSVVVLDVLMVVSGYIATKVKSPVEANVYFTAGLLAFLPIALVLVHQTQNRIPVFLTLGVWTLYPLVHYLRKTALVEEKYATLAYGIMDVVAKIGLVSLLKI